MPCREIGEAISGPASTRRSPLVNRQVGLLFCKKFLFSQSRNLQDALKKYLLFSIHIRLAGRNHEIFHPKLNIA